VIRLRDAPASADQIDRFLTIDSGNERATAGYIAGNRAYVRPDKQVREGRVSKFCGLGELRTRMMEGWRGV
jgi:hypothetical protein